MYENIYSLFSEFCLVDDDYESQCQAIVESEKGSEFFSCMFNIFENLEKNSFKIIKIF